MERRRPRGPRSPLRRPVLPALSMGVLAAKIWAGPQAWKQEQAGGARAEAEAGEQELLWRVVSMESAWLNVVRPRPHPRPRGLSLSLLESISPASSASASGAATAAASPVSAPNTPPSSPTAKEYLSRLLNACNGGGGGGHHGHGHHGRSRRRPSKAELAQLEAEREVGIEPETPTPTPPPFGRAARGQGGATYQLLARTSLLLFSPIVDRLERLSETYNSTRGSSRKARKRVIFKHGDVNVVQGNVAKRRRRYLQDIFTTLVDAQWRWTLLVFALNFVLSWLGFAVIWWLIMLTHGDLRPENLPGQGNPQWTPCVTGISGFASCFLFSVETQHTIGYGGRATTEECPEAIFVMCLQSICGVMIQAFMVGIVFAKLSRPKKRTQTLLFSRHAVVAQRDGQLCLMFRVGDMRKSHIIEAHVRAQLIRRKTTREGEVLPYHQQELQVGGDGEEDKIFFIWPTTIVHKITPESPLYSMSAADMMRERFEIVVILEGVIESTGMTTQARSSYLPNEILWGHRFEPMVSFKKEQGEYEVDYSLFNKTREVDTPLCSSQALDSMFAVGGWRDAATGSDKFEMATHTSSGVGGCGCGVGVGGHVVLAGAGPLAGAASTASGDCAPAPAPADECADCSEVVVWITINAARPPLDVNLSGVGLQTI
ncbi:ATP-sensitive inward rectifier potassium channel 12 [Frankliniella fusca]|uniref:ATP-sensitive inward rectifier potassium channel 12 n=1 Tax=Frankliniella fusca TaxID=407009 RepID=A0AAE1HW14_9NEOP|nr:ATP-sensitive inward rectifier potassium channel 12 [Frankliniella fusca]